MKKTIGVVIGIIAVIAAIVGVRAGIKEYNAHTPVITVSERYTTVKPGDVLDIHDFVDVKVKGEYEFEIVPRYGDKYYELDDDGIIHFLGGDQQAVTLICLECIATGSFHQSDNEWVNFQTLNEIDESNSYEATAAGVRFRVYNNLKDQGNGVFQFGTKPSDNAYEVSVHSVEGVCNMKELEQEIKNYAREKYCMEIDASEYQAEDITLVSGKKARRITFETLYDNGEYVECGSSGGLIGSVGIYAFVEEDRFFFLEDSNSVADTLVFELEQIANTVE